MKSQSQTLRAILYLLWGQEVNKKEFPEFETYYHRKMEEIITHFKTKLL